MSGVPPKAPRAMGMSSSGVGTSGMGGGSKMKISSSLGSRAKHMSGVPQASNTQSGSKGSIPLVYINGRNVTPQTLAPSAIELSDNANRAADSKARALAAALESLPMKSTTATNTAPGSSLPGRRTADPSVMGSMHKLPAKSRGRGDGHTAGGRSSAASDSSSSNHLIILSESPTTTLFSLPSFTLASDTREAIALEAKNASYEAVVRAHKENLDGFTARASQTRNRPLKSQSDSAAPPATLDMGTQVMSYEISDEMREVSSNTDQDLLATGTGSGGAADGDPMNLLSPSTRKYVQETVATALVMPGCLLDTSNITHAPVAATHSKHHSSGGGMSGSRTALGGGKSKSGISTSASRTSGADDDMPIRARNSLTADASTDGVMGMTSHADSTPALGGPSSTGVTASAAVGLTSLTNVDTQALVRAEAARKLLSSPALHSRLLGLERAVQQNANHRWQLDYRDLPDITPLRLLNSSEKTTGAEGGRFGDALGGGKSGFGLKNPFNGLGTLGGAGQLGNLGLFGENKTSSDEENKLKNGVHSGLDSRVRHLFTYSHPELVAGRAVTSMAWNELSPDLLAVGYGQTSDVKSVRRPGETEGGLVLFWSLRNPAYPERIITTPHVVTALAFSQQNPTLLAVGQSSGEVSLYDVARQGPNQSVEECFLEDSSAGMSDGHLDPVWALRWVPSPGDGGREALVSLGGDGRVLRWSRVKGLSVSLLMQLKKSASGEGWISTSAGGLCLDFPLGDPSTYVVGAEDGSLSRCAVAYNEQALETYTGHLAPVYQLTFSPRWPSVFLTASADWTASLYHLGARQPLLTFCAGGTSSTNSSTEEENGSGVAGDTTGTGGGATGMFPINDIAWCPGNSTIFSCVTVNGKVQIWDLATSCLDPVVQIDLNKSDGTIEEAEAALAATKETLAAALDEDEQTVAKQAVEEAEKHLEEVIAASAAEPQSKKDRVLTRVLFGLVDPVLAIGDNEGAVEIFRVVSPVLNLDKVGPKQQYERLKAALLTQVDPAQATFLTNDEPPKGLW